MGIVRGWYSAKTSEEVLASDRYAHDPRVLLLRHDCPRCGVPRGTYCRTSGGYTTLHKARTAVSS